MVNVKLIVIGKTNENYVKEAIEKYKLLLSKYCKFELIEIPDVKNGNKLPSEKLKVAESELLQTYINQKSITVLLDEKGKKMSSEEFAAFFQKQTILSSKINFIIGGSYGFTEQLKQESLCISLSSMTFNHQMVRPILMEQVFRAYTIIHQTGYHH
jgi:23S rRNA (pseudouridine1915-N3)-methyltransferase